MVIVGDVIGGVGSFIGGENNLTYTLLFFTSIIIIYSIFVFYFYRFLARKNILELNLNQYNKYESPGMMKFFAIVFYILEHLIFLPILTFFWFAFLSTLILILAEGIGVGAVLLISAALVASVRVTAHISENLSKDLAKMLPFTLLAIAITKPGFFEVDALLLRIYEIPDLLSQIPQYLIFIVSVELIMKFAEFLNGLTNSSEEIEVEE